MNDSYIRIENLTSALIDAINVAKEQELKISETYRSAYRAGLEDVLEDIKNKKRIRVSYEE